VKGYERGTFRANGVIATSEPSDKRRNSKDDSRVNNHIRETLGILSAAMSIHEKGGGGQVFQLQ
jgi:hypothetical protein